MAVIFLGVFFILQAIFHAMGSPLFLAQKYWDADFRREYQKGLVLPDLFVGIGWIIWGVMNRTVTEQNTASFCVGLIAIAVIPLILLMRNKKKFNI